jgi:AcrR family transcriptional regulator
MGAATGAKRGRPATSSPEEVLRLADALFLAGERVDVTVIAQRLGLGRATIYRWFGSREELIGEVLAREFESLAGYWRRKVRRRGGGGLLAVFDGINRSMASSTALQRLLEQERAAALRLLTSSNGIAQPRAVAAIRALIEAEESANRYDPPADPETLAYAIVRLAEAFLYNDAVIGIRGDHQRLRAVEAALLGVEPGRKRRQSTRKAP